jgi:hypothetical protein
VDAGVLTGAVEHQHNLLGGTGPCLTRERGQFHFKHRNADGGGEMEEGASGGGVHEADQVAPGKAMAHYGNRALADRGPDAPQQRFEADALFIGRPQLDLRLREGGGDRP